jgi:nicotinate phosphoribosyltransferase
MDGFALKTDLYQLMMMAAFHARPSSRRVVTCEAFARKLPPERKFLVMAGTNEIRDFLEHLRFTADDIAFLHEVPALRAIMDSTSFAQYLEDFRFTGSMWAMAEGEIVFPGEPLIRITAPVQEACLAETFILSVLNHDVKIASKAARVVLAARGRQAVDFGTRRTHHEAAVSAARAAYLAGFAGTSNMEAGARFGIPLYGTMSHLWVMVHPTEVEAFEAFQKAYRDPTILIDTFDPIEGAKLAAVLSHLDGVRLDSGNLVTLSLQIRSILDNAGHTSARIVASGDLNEYMIDILMRTGAPIDVFGVGTDLVVSKDAPSLGIVYKTVYDETEHRPLVKIAGAKTTMPGSKQVFLDQRDSGWSHLVAIDGTVNEADSLTPLLDCHIRDGKVVSDPLGLEVARKYCNAALMSLRPGLAALGSEPWEEAPVRLHESVTSMFEKAVKEHELVLE